MTRTVRILGTHGVPAGYGGFETAAEHIGLHLHGRGWRVVVYGQVDGTGDIVEDRWEGLERVLIPEHRPGWRGTSSFDLKSIRHAMRARTEEEVWLTFGYNTGIFDVWPRLRGVPNVINMDGMEWTRRRWGLAKQGILLTNERFAGLVGNALVADHPHIATYLRRHFGRRRVVTITYGAHEVAAAPVEPVTELELEPGRYGIVVCRPIPENSVLEIVTAWSRTRRGMPLVVVGPFGDEDDYHREVRTAASAEVRFPGAIFDQERLRALRFHAAAYLHGHTVGGTNPSLVEAMAAGNAVIAHDNVYNRWVAGPRARYFADVEQLAGVLDEVLADGATLRAMGEASRARFHEEFTWEHIGNQYEEVLTQCLERRQPSQP
jgi:glycosyltransferase involved in cell wall biosynthesis